MVGERKGRRIMRKRGSNSKSNSKINSKKRMRIEMK